jgi:hypothetical protein
MPHRAFAQPEDSNPLYIERDRYFEPLTDALVEDPLLHGLLGLLGDMATALQDLPEWSVKVTPFRVLASADGEGQPTPEGLHRDGVTLVTSLLVGRRNARGGESSVVDVDGHQLLTTTLSKPGTLSPDEWNRVKRHCETGYQVAHSFPDLARIADVILYHHEHWDGTGYPQGLAGEQIPLLARILGIIDAYDVMTHERPYGKTRSPGSAIEELKKGAGRQFDPELVNLFIARVLAQATELTAV